MSQPAATKNTAMLGTSSLKKRFFTKYLLGGVSDRGASSNGGAVCRVWPEIRVTRRVFEATRDGAAWRACTVALQTRVAWHLRNLDEIRRKQVPRQSAV